MTDDKAGMADQELVEAQRLENLRASHSSHHTAGGCAEGLHTGVSQSEDAVRAKAYELWEARGAVHGADQDDWFRAKDLLSQPSTKDSEPAPVAGTLEHLSQAIVDSMQSVVELAATAGHAFAGAFGSSHREDLKKPK